MINPKLFVSYSREDASEFALRLANDLRNAGVDIWLDQVDIQPSQRWDTEIQKSLVASDCILFIVSKKSVVSDNVLDEINYGLSSKKRVIPIIIAKCDIPYRVSRLQHISFVDHYGKGLIELSAAINLDYGGMSHARSEKARSLRLEGRDLFEAGKYKQALAKYSEAIKQTAEDDFGFYCRGNMHYQLKDYQSAIADYSTAIELNPYSDAAYLNRGRSYDKLDKLQAAYNDFTKAIDLNTNESVVYSLRGGVCNALGNYSQAISDCSKAIGLNIDLATAYLNRGVAHHDSGNKYAALEDFNRSLEIKPSAVTYYNRGNCRHILGDKRAGCEDLRKACEMGESRACEQYNDLCRR